MPRITISITAPDEDLDSEFLTLDLPQGLTLQDLRAFVQAETRLPEPALHFYLNGQPLTNNAQTLEDAGVKDGEMLAMLVNRQRAPAQRATQQRRPHATRGRDPTADEMETVRLRTLGDPRAQATLRERTPDLAAVLNDSARFRDVYLRLRREEEEQERERQRQIALLNEDPFNVDAQKKIEEMIRQSNVTENLMHAYENNPEAFGRVTMLYINTEVNGHPVKAFVDSGAQTTIMSPSAAEACGIMRLIDTRFAGIARGVGTAKILGRVHSADIKIGDAIMPCSFTVMEGKDVDLLFGLDMLKRYQACIDLKNNKLVFPHTIVDFLPESEIPKQLEEAQMNEPTIKGPGDMEIGAKTGTVRPAGSSGADGESSSSAPHAAATSSNPAPAASQQNHTQTRAFPQESIDKLQSLGFSREEAIQALHAADGNVEYAAGLLFQG